MEFPIPAGWNKGELLDVKNVGHEYRVKPLSARVPDVPVEPIRFYQTDECQAFVSWWYMR